MTKKEQLDKLKAKILADNVAPDLAKTATKLVFGDGDVDAAVMFVGEAPGKKEDEQGLPFVGAAGKFLNELLASIGMKRQDVYITNIVKYRPPNNRDPLPEEKAAFLPYLQRQIAIIKPLIIATLGRHSMDSLLPGLSISSAHGQPKRTRLQFTDRGSKVEDRRPGKLPQSPVSSPQSLVSSPQSSVQEVVILPLFHPAAALYNGGLRQTLLDDFQAVPILLKKLSKN